MATFIFTVILILLQNTWFQGTRYTFDFIEWHTWKNVLSFIRKLAILFSALQIKFVREEGIQYHERVKVIYF